jgi:hypothetical protein
MFGRGVAGSFFVIEFSDGFILVFHLQIWDGREMSESVPHTPRKQPEELADSPTPQQQPQSSIKNFPPPPHPESSSPRHAPSKEENPWVFGEVQWLP